MNAVAYCRVSTMKGEQIDSLESQQDFFTEYTKRNHLDLVRIYADEGKSGTKIHNRTQLLRLLSDAKKQEFDVVLIKDVSRLARNTVDFLTSIRQLKQSGVHVIFVNYDQTSSDSSEFMLTMLSAIAQEESANTSKRVKFGKKINAEKGRVPNIIYGYDKKAGDYFNLSIHPTEALVVQQIFSLYTEKLMGAASIAKYLNAKGIRTKRNCQFTQSAVTRILTNPIYTGCVINGKEEVEDFLTGKRKELEKEDWMIVKKEELKIIEEELFLKASEILKVRAKKYARTGKRKSDKNVFSKVIFCESCNAAFRQYKRTYKNTITRWMCSRRNAQGISACDNATSIKEEVLIKEIAEYLKDCVKHQEKFIREVQKTFIKSSKNAVLFPLDNPETQSKLRKLKRNKQKYMEMYENDIISLQELKEKTLVLNAEITEIERITGDPSCGQDEVTAESFINEHKDFLTMFYNACQHNDAINQLINRITVNQSGEVHIFLKQF